MDLDSRTIDLKHHIRNSREAGRPGVGSFCLEWSATERRGGEISQEVTGA